MKDVLIKQKDVYLEEYSTWINDISSKCYENLEKNNYNPEFDLLAIYLDRIRDMRKSTWDLYINNIYTSEIYEENVKYHLEILRDTIIWLVGFYDYWNHNNPLKDDILKKLNDDFKIVIRINMYINRNYNNITNYMNGSIDDIKFTSNDSLFKMIADSLNALKHDTRLLYDTLDSMYGVLSKLTDEDIKDEYLEKEE